MARTLRLTETWFNRGLVLLALVFAVFLIGLGEANGLTDHAAKVRSLIDPLIRAPAEYRLTLPALD